MYTKTTWTTSVAINAERMNHLETQYDEFMSILNAHDHDDRYYTKDEADDRYYWSGNMGYGSGADADTLDGMHLSDILGSSLPVGAICIWKGSEATIPSGWVKCDGSNGTPDLRDRFVQGGTLNQIGTTGGSYGITTMGGTVTTYGTSLSTNHIPSHYHKYQDYYSTGAVGSGADYSTVSSNYTDTSRTSSSTGSGNPHDHGSFGVTFSSFLNIPMYYALYYIMKKS